ncbi:structural protein [Paenibacillus vulneris]|uniref:Head decoration protein n=1 Tax=Paenibacillus vulneris TaxID=1133364 RepID=A0ABW3UXX4_9BACL
MSKFIETSYTNKKEILKFPDHYVALAVTVDDAGITANAEGKKIVPAGTIVGNSILSDPTKKAKKAVTTTGVSNAEGVLLNDTDVTYGPAAGAMVIHGFIDLNKIPTAPATEEIAALRQITFLK